ncbi:cytochrome P450 6a2-like [Prorops nasuta]|uniref:cytochrome P450 6a2-like n=1 Tax=Prorops nasuta TaxID=863751 RepID=UPI0034CDC327
MISGILTVICVFLVFIYYYCNSNFNFWKSRGVLGPEPFPIFGNYMDILTSRYSLGLYLKSVYNDFKGEPLVGIFFGRTPLLVVQKPELIRDVMVKDFPKFSDRINPAGEKIEPLSQHLFFLEAQRWRPLRLKLSSIFSSGKMKDMFPLILEVADKLDNYLSKVISKEESLELRELMARYTIGVIASFAFDLKFDSFQSKECDFLKFGRTTMSTNFSNLIKFQIRRFFPLIYNLLGYILPESDTIKFFRDVTVDSIAQRKNENIVKGDFTDTLIDIKNNASKLPELNITDSLLASQAFVFFIAGFESPSMTMCNTLYELALNQGIQDKLRTEIQKVNEQNGGTWKYEDVHQIIYLDMVIKETLRKYPPVPMLMRKSTCEYTFNDTNLTIPKNQKILIPLYAIHCDADIYPNPDQFDPERFTDENSAKRNPNHYMPFGDGPRSCIGSRLAANQIKIGITKILLKYKVDVSEKTMIPYAFDTSAILLAPLGDIYLKLIKI